MAKRIALPDGSIGEFPDAMPDSEIETVLRRQFGGPSTDRFTAGTAAARAADQGIADKAQADADAVNAYRLASADKSQPPGVAEQFLGGAKHAWDRAAMGVKGLVTGLTPEEEQLLSQGKAFVKGTGPASTVGQIAADVGMSLAPVARGAQVLTKTLSGLGRAAPVVADIATNAGYAAATAPEDRGEAMAWGGGGAAFGQMLPRAVARLVKPYNPGKGTQALIDAGVTPTLGDAMAADQRALGAAVVRSGERLVESTPLAGSVLRSTRQRALDDFQRATREAALPPGASKEAAATIDSLGEAFGKAYADTLSQVPFPAKAFAVFQPLKAVDEAVVGTTLTPSHVRRARSFVSDTFHRNMGDAVELSAREAHWIESQLKARAFQFKKSTDPLQQEFGGALHDVARSWAEAWRGALDPTTKSIVDALDAQYAKFVPVRRVGATGNLANPDDYTPKQLLMAIRAGDKNPNKSTFIAGEMPQQHLASAGAHLTLPKEGVDTATKLLTAAGAVSPLFGLGIPAAVHILLSAGYSTQTVQKYLLGQLGPHTQQILAAKLRAAAPAAAQFGRATATQQGAADGR